MQEIYLGSSMSLSIPRSAQQKEIQRPELPPICALVRCTKTNANAEPRFLTSLALRKSREARDHSGSDVTSSRCPLLLQADKGGDRRRVATQRKPQLLCHLKVIPTNVTQIWVKPKIRPTSHAASAQPALVKKPTQNQTPIW